MDPLSLLAQDFAAALVAADAKLPVAINQRTGTAFQPGIGPHSETQTIRLAVFEMQAAHPARYAAITFDVPYPDKPRQRCDLRIGGADGPLFIEGKLLRILGDNGKPNDNMLMHIFSPYPQHRSAVTDCEKLRKSEFKGQKAILIVGFSYPGWPLEPAINAFEVIAGRNGGLGQRRSAPFSGLCHPIHSSGTVIIWPVP